MRAIFLILLLTLPLEANDLRVLVNPFQNDGNPKYSWIAIGLTNRVVAALGKIKNIKVITEESRKLALKEMNLSQTGIIQSQTALEVGQFLGANRAIQGNYTVLGQKISFSASLLNLATGVIIKSSEFTIEENELLTAHRRLVYELFAKIKKQTIANLQPMTEKKDTASLNAYKFYAKGLESIESNRTEAMLNFKQTIALQPQHKEAHKYIGYLYSQLGKYSLAARHLTQAQKYYQQKEQDSPEYAELLRFLGSNHYYQGEYSQAMGYYKQAKTIYNTISLRKDLGFADLLYSLGTTQSLQKKYHSAYQYYKKSKQLYDEMNIKRIAGYANLMYGIGYLYLLKNKYEQALPFFRYCEISYQKNNMATSRHYADTLYILGRLYEIRRNRPKALQYFRRCLQAFHKNSGTHKKSSIQKTKQAILRLEK